MEGNAVGEITERFETIRAVYRAEDNRGIPMSVRERYERALSEIRSQIRMARRKAGGKRLGEFLLAQGALDKGELEQALKEQDRNGRKKLLGEVLIDLGIVGPEAVRSAIEEQAAAEGRTYTFDHEIRARG